jgi:hypothetical protein
VYQIGEVLARSWTIIVRLPTTSVASMVATCRSTAVLPTGECYLDSRQDSNCIDRLRRQPNPDILAFIVIIIRIRMPELKLTTPDYVA